MKPLNANQPIRYCFAALSIFVVLITNPQQTSITYHLEQQVHQGVTCKRCNNTTKFFREKVASLLLLQSLNKTSVIYLY